MYVNIHSSWQNFGGENAFAVLVAPAGRFFHKHFFILICAKCRRHNIIVKGFLENCKLFSVENIPLCSNSI